MIALLMVQVAILFIGISLVVRVWRASVLHGVLCLCIPGYVIVPMIRYWNEPDHNIRWHVALLLCGAIASVWLQHRAAEQLLAMHAQLQAELSAPESEFAAGNLGDDNASSDDGSDDVGGEVRLGAASGFPEHNEREADPSHETPVESSQTDTAPTPPRDAAASSSASAGPDAAPTRHEAVASATFYRGLFQRPGSGIAIDLPSHFHALGSADARHIEASAGQAYDSHELAWVVHESVTLENPASWHVSVRWLGDGWVAPPSVALNAEHLLRDAQRSAASPQRLAGSRGDFVGYAIAPSFNGDLVAWVEERLPAGAAASVLDCHALRLGRNGLIEFSVVGAPAGAQVLCYASVRLLARHTRFDANTERPQGRAPGAEVRRAPYTLDELIARRG